MCGSSANRLFIDATSAVIPKMNVTTTAEFDGNKFETSMSLLLDAAGALVVESTRPDFQGGGAPVTSKMTYKKG